MAPKRLTFGLSLLMTVAVQRQKAASFNLDEVIEKLKEGHGK
jgi:hypothetical protein